MTSLHSKNILVGVCGGIAAYKVPEIVRRLRDQGASVRVVMTAAATAFVTPLTFQAVSGMPVRTELLDSESESGMDHISLARWADLVLLAPATADTLARLAQGRADDLLSTLCLATEATILAAPAMNRVMWQKPATRRNVERLGQDGVVLLGPAEGAQACGETGAGRMLEPAEIVRAVARQAMAPLPRLEHLRVMVTAGPTWEPLDPVRGLTNLSSGKMGYAVAEAFVDAGARVTLVSGPCQLPPPAVAGLKRVQTAREMLDAVLADIDDQDIFIAVAAVADYRPDSSCERKMKKSDAAMTLTLAPNPDILATVAARAERPFCVGFAAETNDVIDYARGKLEAKRLDLIAANLVGAAEGGFNADDNTLVVLSASDETRIGPAAKTEVARELCRLIASKHGKTRSD